MSLIARLSARRKWALGATGVLILVFVAVWIIDGGQRSTTASGTPTVDGGRATGMTAQPPSGPGSLTLEQQRDLERSIKAMRALAAVEPATTPQHPAVSRQARQQPDLYAAAFAGELLTQDYRTSSRQELLAWVQSESAQSTDPLVVGLTPVDLRSRMAVASVQDGINGLAPVPSQSDWAKLAGECGRVQVRLLTGLPTDGWVLRGGRRLDRHEGTHRLDALLQVPLLLQCQ